MMFEGRELGGKLPPGWRWVKLADVCTLNPRRPVIVSSDEQPTYFVPMSAVDEQQGAITRPEFRPYREVRSGFTYFETSDVIFAKITPCMQNGKHAIVPHVPDGRGFGSTEFHVIRTGSAVIPQWIHLFVRQPSILTQAMAHFTGAVGQRRVPDGFLADLQIPLPPLSEQRRIAAILNEQMAAVERGRSSAEAQLAAARALPAAYLREMFEGSEARKWPRRQLGEILRLRKEIIHPHDNPSGPAIFVGLEHIESHTGIRTGSLLVEMSTLAGRKPRFCKGDILYGYLRPYLNKVWVAEFDGLCSVDQYVYSVDTLQADTVFVAWFMRSPIYRKRAPIDTTPGQLPRIRTEEVAAVEINLPPVPLQREMGQRILRQTDTEQQLRQGLERQRDAINLLPAALLRLAFAGAL